MKKKYLGQITVEAAIVMPIIMIIIASLMYFSFYVHDVVKIKSFVYLVGSQNADKEEKEFEETIKEELKKASLFIMESNVECEKNKENFQIHILLKKTQKIKWLDMLLNIDNSAYTINIEKEINCKILYAGRAICDELKSKEER